MSTSGGQPNNNNAGKGKRIKSVIAERMEARQSLVKMIDSLLDDAEGGDKMAMNMVFDRFEGKPKQQTEITGADDGPLLIQRVERLIIDTSQVISDSPTD